MEKFVKLLLAAMMFLISGCAPKNENIQTEDPAFDYAETLFDTSYVHTVEVNVSDFDALVKNAAMKEKHKADVTIDGEKIMDVSFAVKGNTSLKYVSDDPSTDRFSFKINFGKYVKGQTFHGLDKLHLNNTFMDPTYSKDYFSYEIFRQCGVDASLVSFVNLKINDRDFGLYIAVENVGDSFLKRTGRDGGNLYKPEESRFQEESNVGGSDLVYRGDEFEKYPEIFEEAETDFSEEDAAALILALKKINAEEDLEEYLNVDEVIRYFAAHIFTVCNDGYAEEMFHNYFLYEKDGRLEMLPWDYNSAFAGYDDEISSLAGYKDYDRFASFDIHKPIENNDDYSRRPMFRWIIDEQKYTDRYHEVFRKLISDYFDSGEFIKEAERIKKMIEPYVKNTQNAFFPVETFDDEYSKMLEFCRKRADAIRVQTKP